MNALERRRYRRDRLTKPSPAFRKLRTRTLIQLGGLVEKVGLLKTLDIAMGVDLQKDEDVKDAVATLLGALVDVESTLRDDAAQRRLCFLKGQAAFQEQEPT